MNAIETKAQCERTLRAPLQVLFGPAGFGRSQSQSLRKKKKERKEKEKKKTLGGFLNYLRSDGDTPHVRPDS